MLLSRQRTKLILNQDRKKTKIALLTVSVIFVKSV